MNTPIDNLQAGQQIASTSKPLWAAVGILATAVLAMGGTMIYQQRAPVLPAPVAQVALAVPSAPSASSPQAPPVASAADDLIEKPVTAPKVVKVIPKPVPKPIPKPKPEPSYAGVSPAPTPYPAPIPMPAPVPVAAAQVCTVCGSIESVTPVQRTTKPDGPGMGTVAGGVLGAVLGHQVGQGNGRTAATILGAIGGGFAGNAVERNVRKETVYQVGVRMEDGSRRTLEVALPPSVGSRVTVEGSTIRTNDGVVYRAPAAVTHSTPNETPSEPRY